jgi:hypothetical protein
MENRMQNNRCCFDISANNPELNINLPLKKGHRIIKNNICSGI